MTDDALTLLALEFAGLSSTAPNTGCASTATLASPLGAELLPQRATAPRSAGASTSEQLQRLSAEVRARRQHRTFRRGAAFHY